MHGKGGNGRWPNLLLVGPDTIDCRFLFSSVSAALLLVARTVSAEWVASLSAYFRFRLKVKFPLSVDL